MSCPEHEIIEDFVLGKLETDQLAEFEEHIQNCENCAAKVHEASENEKLLTELRTFGQEGKKDSSKDTVDDLTIDDAQAFLGERYRVIRKVGQGSAGQVFQAVDTVLERLVAVKFLMKRNPSADSNAEDWREARLMSQLNHPNIAQIYEVGENDSQRFIVMEWVDGLPISEAWKGLILEQRLRMYLGILDAVGVAHRRGIVHRDIKPSNILVSSELKPKVLDFGIALETSALENLETSVYRGTPAYSAPEQITRPVKISSATDVFALGVLLYQLLTDVLPFPQTKPEELFEAIRNKFPELPNAVAERIPIPLQNICLKALEKEPDNRYLSAEALCGDINRYLRGEKVWSKPSFLADKIQQEVFYHRQKLSVWCDSQLITEREHDKLDRIYERVVSPPDPSIIEARELSLSQVCLYLGGWISVLGSLVLFYGTWENVPESLRPVPAIFATAIMILFGIRMWNKKESRLAVGFLITSSLLVPLTALLIFDQWHVFDPVHYPWGNEGFSLEEDLSFGNAQLYLSSYLWLICSALFLKTTRSSIFVLSSTIAFIAYLTVCYVIGGMEDWEQHTIAGRYLYPGIGLFVAGIILDRRKLTQYAIPLSVIGLILMVGSLSFIARSYETLFGWLWPYYDFEEQENPIFNMDERVGLSFIANGLFYLGLASLCQRMGTSLQRRLAQIFNWLGPLHILGALRILDWSGPDEDLSNDNSLTYRMLLPIASVAFVLASVARQMKSFFFSGLSGVAAAIYRYTICDMYKYFFWPFGLIVTGFIGMLTSMLVPRLQARLRLRSGKK